MIPLEEYLIARKQFQNRSGWGGSLCFFGVFVGLILCSIVLKLFEPDSNEPAPLVAIVFGLFLFVAASIAGLYSSIRLTPRKQQFAALKCPHCEKLIQDLTGVVVATGKCPTCLNRVVKVAPDAKDLGTPLLTIAQLQWAKRWQWRAGVTAVVLFSCGMIAFSLIAIAGCFLQASDVISIEMGQAALRLNAWMLGTVLLVCFVLMVAAFCCFEVRCPNCRKYLLRYGTVIASGNCLHCGTTVLQDAIPHSEYRPLPKLAKVESALVRFSTRWVICVMLRGIVGSILMIGAVEIDRSFLQQRVEPSINLVRLGVYLVGILTMAFSFLVPFAFRRFNRYPELVCQNCQRAIYGNSLVARCTGNCPHCGQRVIKDA